MGGFWSWESTFLLPVNDARIQGMLTKAWAWVEPFEQKEAYLFPFLKGGRIYQMDWMVYSDGGTGLAVSYHRLDKADGIISGWDGSVLFRAQEEALIWHGRGKLSRGKKDLSDLVEELNGAIAEHVMDLALREYGYMKEEGK